MSVEVPELAEVLYKPLQPKKVEAAPPGVLTFEPPMGPAIIIKTDPEQPDEVTVSRGREPFRHLYEVDIKPHEQKTGPTTEPTTIVTLIEGSGDKALVRRGTTRVDRVVVNGPARVNAFGSRLHIEPSQGRDAVNAQMGASTRPQSKVK